jgi:hypothetical protein
MDIILVTSRTAFQPAAVAEAKQEQPKSSSEVAKSDMICGLQSVLSIAERAVSK